MPTTQIRGRQILNKDITGEDFADDLIINADGSTGSFSIAGDPNKILFSATSASGTIVIAGNVSQAEINSLNLNSGDVFVTGSHVTITGSVIDIKGQTVFHNGLSGSITHLQDGSSYIIGASGVYVTTGSNGSITLSTNQPVSVSNITELKLLDDSLYPNGTTCSVISLLDIFYLDKSSTLTSDDITVATPLSTSGRWVRLNVANKKWKTQTTWYIDASTGSDENAGTSSAPIKTISEWHRRVGTEAINVDMTIYLMSNLQDTDNITGFIAIGLNGRVTITGEKAITPILSGSFTSVTTIDPANNQPWEITDTSLPTSNYWTSYATSSSVIGKRIRIDGGARNNAIAWVAKDLGSKTARISQPIIANSTMYLSSMASIQTGDNYVIEQLPSISSFSPQIKIPVVSYTTPSRFQIKDVAFKNATGAASPNPGGCDDNTNSTLFSTAFSMINCDTRLQLNGSQAFLNCRFIRLNQILTSANGACTIYGGLFLGPTSYSSTSYVQLKKFGIAFRFMIQAGTLYSVAPTPTLSYISSVQIYDSPFHAIAVESNCTAYFAEFLSNKEAFGKDNANVSVRVYRNGCFYYDTPLSDISIQSFQGNVQLGTGTAPLSIVRTYAEMPCVEIDKNIIDGVPRIKAHTYFSEIN